MEYKTKFKFVKKAWSSIGLPVLRGGATTDWSDLWQETTYRDFMVCGPPPEAIQEYYAVEKHNGIVSIDAATYIAEEMDRLHQTIVSFFDLAVSRMNFAVLPGGTTYSIRIENNTADTSRDMKILHSNVVVPGQWDFIGTGARYDRAQLPRVMFLDSNGKLNIFFAAVPLAMPWRLRFSQEHKRYPIWVTNRRPKLPGFYKKSLRN